MGLASCMSAFSVTKLFSGLLTGDYWGKLIAFGMGFLLVGFLSYAVYKAYVKPIIPESHQDAEVIINPSPRSTFGCASTRVYDKYPVNSIR